MCEITISDGILAITALLILWSIRVSAKNVKVSSENIELQRKYIELVTRPWVYYELRVKVLCDNLEKKIKIESVINNVGGTPAFGCILFAKMSENDNYPFEYFKEIELRSINYITKFFIAFPKQENTHTLIFDAELKEEDKGAVQPTILRNPFLHTYLKYKSEDGTKYYLKQTNNIIDYEEGDNNIIAKWVIVRADAKPL